MPDMPDLLSSAGTRHNFAGRPQVSMKDVRLFAFDDLTQLFGQSSSSQPSHNTSPWRVAQLYGRRFAGAPCRFDRPALKNAGSNLQSTLPLTFHKLGGKALGATCPE